MELRKYAIHVGDDRFRPGAETDELGLAKQFAHYIAYTEGRDVAVYQRYPSMRTVARFDAATIERPDFELTFPQIVALTETDDLRELLHDAESDHQMQWTRVKTIVDELVSRAD